ncbi:MAG: hypothetical protein LBD70_04880 [Bifidobacteriaceae bacterium]|jgi:hypothetical protein|nr:hypothetical protein [Bifidobacteriaceae bacterium]
MSPAIEYRAAAEDQELRDHDQEFADQAQELSDEAQELAGQAEERSAAERARALHGAEDPSQFRLEHQGDYEEPSSRAVAIEPFKDPATTVEFVNPKFNPSEGGPSEYNSNCADCARCFEATWRGERNEAAGLAKRTTENGRLEAPDGETDERTEEWSHNEFAQTEPAALRQSLEQAGHGASAIVHSGWEGPGGPGGHAYNVVNYRGEIKTVDAQEGEVLEYSDQGVHPWLEDCYGVNHRTMAWDARGRRIL